MLLVARTPPIVAPPGVWTADVAMAWLGTLDVPGLPGVTLHRGPTWPRGGSDRVLRCTAAPGSRGGRGAGEEASRDESWRGIQLAARGRQRDDSDRDAETIAAAAHARIVRARTGVWLPAGTGRVWLVPGGLSWPAGGPSPMGPVPDDAERHIWTCTYLVHVIEYPAV